MNWKVLEKECDQLAKQNKISIFDLTERMFTLRKCSEFLDDLHSRNMDVNERFAKWTENISWDADTLMEIYEVFSSRDVWDGRTIKELYRLSVAELRKRENPEAKTIRQDDRPLIVRQLDAKVERLTKKLDEESIKHKAVADAWKTRYQDLEKKYEAAIKENAHLRRRLNRFLAIAKNENESLESQSV